MQTILAIDWGSRHAGTALGNTVARIATPLKRIPNDEKLFPVLRDIIVSEDVDITLVGLPRNLEGEETAQSAEIRQFASRLSEAVQCPVLLQDETLSTLAGQSLGARFTQADKDSLAAAVILQDYLQAL